MILLLLVVALIPGVVMVHASEPSSITDVMRGYSDTTKPVESDVEKVTGGIVPKLGTLTSVIMYAIFAMTFFTTACDLAYIALPPLRPFLYSPTENEVNTQNRVENRRG